MVRRWLDSWTRGLVGSMNEFGARGSPDGVRVVGGVLRVQVNALPSWLGRGFDGAPWRAVQRAALATLTRDGGAAPDPAG
jgi:hypothetical protein